MSREERTSWQQTDCFDQQHETISERTLQLCERWHVQEKVYVMIQQTVKYIVVNLSYDVYFWCKFQRPKKMLYI